MENPNNSQDRPESQKPKPHGRSRFLNADMIGAPIVIVFVFALGSGYYAYNYIEKDSIRIQFWVGFMFSFSALVVIVCQALIYAQQAEFMEQQARSSTQLIELMVISECAYIRVGELQIPQPIKNQELVITGKLFNGGRTPAWNFQRQLKITLGYGLPPRDWGVNWETSKEESPVGMIVAGGDTNFTATMPDVTQDMISQINKDELLILLDGECRYFDSLGGKIFYRFGYTFELEPPRAVERYQTHYREKVNPN